MARSPCRRPSSPSTAPSGASAMPGLPGKPTRRQARCCPRTARQACGPPRSASAPTFRAHRLEPEETMADLYDIGEKPPLGEVPARMHAYVVRQNRFGQPRDAWKREVIPTPAIGPDEVLIYVMASGINYNNVWAALGQPIDVIAERQKLGEPEDFHAGGSDCSGIVWATGKDVKNVTRGDEVIVHSGWWRPDDPWALSGKDPTLAESTRICGHQTNYGNWAKGARAFGKASWDALGEKASPQIVFEHPGEATLPTSEFVCATGGKIVICAGTTGYNVTLDLRYHWMRQKRFQGSHLSNDAQAAAVTKLVADGKVDPCLSKTYDFDDIPACHQLMLDNKHAYGNMAVLVNARQPGQGRTA